MLCDVDHTALVDSTLFHTSRQCIPNQSISKKTRCRAHGRHCKYYCVNYDNVDYRNTIINIYWTSGYESTKIRGECDKKCDPMKIRANIF